MTFLPLAKLQEPLPFWDLFEALINAGFKLTVDRYHDLQRSIWLGYIATWDDLKDVSTLLWVKPSEGDRERLLFDREFTKYRAQIGDLGSNESETPDRLLLDLDKPLQPLPLYPPPRKTNRPLEPSTQPNYQSLAGIKTTPPDRQPTNKDWKFTLDKLPISSSMVEDSWRNLRQTKLKIELEIDLTQTIEQMNPLGIIEEIVWDSIPDVQANSIVLVDDGENMQTYWPGIRKLFEAIEQKLITPAQIYRFSNYPGRFLYRWKKTDRSQRSVSVESVLKNSSPEHTMVVIVSDCGAAIGLNDGERVQGTIDFLQRWQKVVRPIVWINPVPSDRWAGTTAEKIQEYLRGRMLTPEQFNGAFLHSLMGSRGWQE